MTGFLAAFTADLDAFSPLPQSSHLSGVSACPSALAHQEPSSPRLSAANGNGLGGGGRDPEGTDSIGAQSTVTQTSRTRVPTLRPFLSRKSQQDAPDQVRSRSRYASHYNPQP